MIHNLYNLYNAKRVKLATFLMIDAKWRREKENEVYLSHVFFGEFSITDFRLRRIVHIGHRISINDSTNDISSKIVRVSRSSRVRTQRGTYNYVKDETWKRTSSGKK